jgi:hypothetical protein
MLGKELSVFGDLNRLNGSPEDFDTKPFEFIFELDSDVESRLTTKGAVDA